MLKSEQLDLLLPALTLARGEMVTPKRTSKNPDFQSKPARLGVLQESVIPPLLRHGLFVSQVVEFDSDGLYLTTFLAHISGQFLSSSMRLVLAKNDMESVGSATMHAKLIALAALVCLTAEEDNDAAECAQHNPRKESRTDQTRQQAEPAEKPADTMPVPQEKSGPLTPDQLSIIKKSFDGCIAGLERLMSQKYEKPTSVESLNERAADRIIANLEGQVKRAKAEQIELDEREKATKAELTAIAIDDDFPF